MILDVALELVLMSLPALGVETWEEIRSMDAESLDRG
jgi:hypothetical protein